MALVPCSTRGVRSARPPVSASLEPSCHSQQEAASAAEVSPAFTDAARSSNNTCDARFSLAAPSAVSSAASMHDYKDSMGQSMVQVVGGSFRAPAPPPMSSAGSMKLLPASSAPVGFLMPPTPAPPAGVLQSFRAPQLVCRHTRTHARTHARAHTHTRTHTHTILPTFPRGVGCRV